MAPPVRRHCCRGKRPESETKLNGDTPLKFDIVEVAAAYISADRRALHFELLDGALNKHELAMLIHFLQAKREQLSEP